jgi:bifunctional isochorismate lyase/aryl carrier protein
MADIQIRSGQCALLIYDFTDELIDAKAAGYEPWAAEKIPLLKQLIEACHRADVPVYFALPQSSLDKRDVDRAGDAICGPVKPGSEDTVIVRPKSGAIADSPLEGLLRQQARTTLLIAGMAVDRGCNTAARDAQKLDLRPVMVEDVCFTRDIRSNRFGFIPKNEIHRVHLASLERAGVGITSVEELIRLLGSS